MNTAIATPHPAIGPGTAVANADGAHLLWCDVVAQIGCEMEETVDSVIDQMRAMMSTGRLDRQAMLDLRCSLRRAKQISTNSRYIAHLAGRPSRVVGDAVQLADIVRDVIAEREADIRSHGAVFTRALPGVEIVADRALLVTLIHAVITWALEQASGSVAVCLEPSPKSARLSCRFRHRVEGPRRSRFGGPATWGSSWHLVRHAAQALHWTMRTGDDDENTWLHLDFPYRPASEPSAFDAIEVAAAAPAGTPERSFVLFVGPVLELHCEVRDAVRDAGIELAFCHSPEEASQRLAARVPRAVVFDGEMPDADVHLLRAEALRHAPTIVFIGIEDGTDAFEVTDMTNGAVARVGRRGLASSLPVALLLALAAEASAEPA